MTSRFGGLFWRVIVRRWWRHPLLTILNVLSISLGVAVFLAVQIANRGALSSFRSAAELATGRTDLEIRGDLRDEIFPEVRRVAGVRAAAPVIEGIVAIDGHPGEYLRIIGIDPLAGGDFMPFRLRDVSSGDFGLEQWLRDSGTIALQPAMAEKSGNWMRDGAISVLSDARHAQLRPIFLIEPDTPLAGADPRLAAMDIGWAQELLGKPGRLSSIQILLENPQDAGLVAEALRELVPADAVVAPPLQRSKEMESMLGAFQLNLAAMSLVSVVVGMFLIANSVSASVVRRRTEVAILRAAGATRFEVRSLFLGEALLEAVLGSSIGLAVAPLLAAVLAGPIAQSVSAIYSIVSIGRLALEPWQIGEAYALGLAAAFMAAWLPASEAARYDPAKILHPGAAVEVFSPLRRPILLVFSAVFLAAAWALSAYVLSGGWKILGFLSAAFVLAGFSMLVPWLAAFVAAIFRACGVLPRLAADHLVRSLHRSAATIAALAAAVAMTVSVSVMIHSFRASVERWLGRTIVADLYMAPAINETAGLQAFLPDGAAAWASSTDGIREISTFREMPIRIRDQKASLAVITGKARGELEFLDGPQEAAMAGFNNGEVAVSESFASRFSVKRDDEISIPAPKGEQPFRICGIYRDFTRDSGTILMRRDVFEKYWTDSRIHSLALKLGSPEKAAGISEAFRKEFGGEGEFAIYDNAVLRGRVMDIFDKTFAVTSALRTIALIVAVVGVVFSLGVLVAERERELGVLRALGASRFQISVLFLGEAALIGLAASICGLASGAVLSMVLTWVINKAFFGWTIALSYPLGIFLLMPLWIVPAAILAAIPPAWRASRLAPAQAVRFE